MGRGLFDAAPQKRGDWASFRTEGRFWRWLQAAPKSAPSRREHPLTPYETRLAELLDQLEATLKEVREHLDRGKRQAEAFPATAVDAFADEAFRDRDA